MRISGTRLGGRKDEAPRGNMEQIGSRGVPALAFHYPGSCTDPKAVTTEHTARTQPSASPNKHKKKMF